MSGEITKSVLIDAPASVIFKALTDENELVQWMPKRAKMDARVGGEYEFNFYRASDHSETIAKGKIVELVPNRRVVYTFASSMGGLGPNPSLLTWTIEESSGGKTLVTLVHSGIPEKSFNLFVGWGFYLDQLAAHCPRMSART
jgi:uncharacterized protein YndB with AHSA1/START domain